MNNSLKAAVLSGLIFPGLGQIVLKHYKRGAVIMLTVLVSLSVVVAKAVQHALTILEKIESEGGAISMSTISNAATQASATSASLTFNLVLLLVTLCWIIGVVDAYRIGKKKDIEEGSTS
jgi:beta-lactamase regulating signal transducer with metallopeptidase domain